MQQGIFEKSITVTPDYCDAAAQLSPLAAFTIFQGIAAQHAELIGVGGAGEARRVLADRPHARRLPATRRSDG